MLPFDWKRDGFDLIGYTKMDDKITIQEAAAAGIRSIENLIFQLNHCQKQSAMQINYREITDHTVSKFKKMISILNRTGHARFRRCPLQPALPMEAIPVAQPQNMTLDFTKPTSENPIASARKRFCVSTLTTPISSGNSSFMSSITGDGSVSNGRNGGSTSLLPPVRHAGKPPMYSSTSKKRCQEHSQLINVYGKLAASGGRCHCSKRRKNRVKKTIRVPAISLKMAEIPADEYSWRKYGQKPIKGSPYPRGYYKCSSVRGCPARKHVERAPDNPSMLIVTYECDHRHSQLPVTGILNPHREI